MLTLGVITDEHFGPRAFFGGKLRKLSHLAPELTRAFAARMREGVRPDLVVNLGDVVEDESHAADLGRYRECVANLKEAGSELVNVAGNHDLAHLGAEDLRREWGLEPGPLHSSFDRGGFHMVVLCSYERKDRDVRLGDEQLAWLEADLAKNRLPVVVLMHHSAADQDLRGNRWFEKAAHIALVKDRRRLRELLARDGKTRLVLNGHLHWNHLDVVDGIPYVTVQSLIENIDEDAPGRPAAAWAVVRLTDRGVHVEVEGAQPARYQLAR